MTRQLCRWLTTALLAGISAIARAQTSAPSLSLPTSVSFVVGRPVDYEIENWVTGTTSYGATGLPPGLIFNSSKGIVSGAGTTVGNYSVVFSASNSVGTTSSVCTFVIESVPAVPVIQSIPDREDWRDTNFGRPIQGYYHLDATNSPTKWTVSGTPAEVHFNDSLENPSFGWWPTELVGGEYTVTVTASNESGSSSTTFRWIIHPALDSLASDKALYTTGDTITMTASFSAPVVFSGAPPYVQLWGSKRAAYVSGNGTANLVFRYTVTSDDPNTSGFTAQAVTGAISTLGGTSAKTSIPGTYTSYAGFAVVQPTPENAAKIVKVTGNPAGTFRDLLNFTVDFSAPVTVTGAPDLTITVGGTTRHARYGSGSGTNELRFTYPIASGENGPVTVVSPINLNAGAITGIVNIPAVLTFTPPDLSNVKVDTTPPPAPIITAVQPSPVKIRGTAEPGCSVRLQYASMPAVLERSSTGADGNWQISISDPLPDIPLVVVAVDAAGNEGPPSNSFSALVAFTAPAPAPSNSTSPASPTANSSSNSTPPANATKTNQAITFNSPVSAVVVGQPIALGATSSTGSPLTYSVVAGDATISGNVLTPQTTARLVVRASSAGSDTINAAVADVDFGNPQKAAQIITVPATPLNVAAEAPVTLTATSSAGLPVTYGVVSGPATISGNVLTFTGSGTVVVRATQSGSTVFSPASDVTLTIIGHPTDRFVNLSARVHVETADAPAIAGFVIAGTEPKPVLIRAVGPGLASFGVANVVTNPILTVHDSSGAIVATNAGWSGNPQVSTISNAVGAFTLSAQSQDAALVATLAPGNYSAEVASSAPGNVLLEVYDAANAPVPTKRLINLSARASIENADGQLVLGFVISGDAPKRVLVRAVGPSLAQFGVSTPLADPTLKVIDANNGVVAQNDDWSTQLQPGISSSDIAVAEAATGAFAFPSGSKDAATVVTLPPGAYTAVVNGANVSGGTALVEIYEVP